MNLTSWKVLTLAVVFFDSLIGFHLPLLLKASHGGGALSIANTFAGGVFLSTGLVHMLADANESLDVGYPVAFVVAGASFFLVMLIEQAVHTHHGHSHGSGGEGHGRDRKESRSTRSDSTPEIQPILVEPVLSERSVLLPPPMVGGATNGYSSVANSAADTPSHHSHGHGHGGSSKPRKAHDHLDITIFPNGASDVKALDSPMFGSHSRKSTPVEAQTHDFFNAILLSIVLSIHAFLEGLAVGSSVDQNRFWVAFIAVVSHKWIDGFALGSNIHVSNLRTKMLQRKHFIALGSVFSIVTPIGIAVGILIDEEASSKRGTQDLVSGVLQAICSGTFFYIAIYEVIIREFHAGASHTWLKALSFTLGYSVMCVIAIWM